MAAETDVDQICIDKWCSDLFTKPEGPYQTMQVQYVDNSVRLGKTDAKTQQNGFDTLRDVSDLYRVRANGGSSEGNQTAVTLKHQLQSAARDSALVAPRHFSAEIDRKRRYVPYGLSRLLVPGTPPKSNASQQIETISDLIESAESNPPTRWRRGYEDGKVAGHIAEQLNKQIPSRRTVIGRGATVLLGVAGLLGITIFGDVSLLPF